MMIINPLMLVLAWLFKCGMDDYRAAKKEEEKWDKQHPKPMVEGPIPAEVYHTGPSYSHDMAACLDPDWMSKPRRRPEMVTRRIR
jgi:hypothetical protein